MIRVSLLSVAAVLAFAAGSAPSAFAKDGVYTSTTLGRNGDVTVQTTITNGRIADVKVLDWSETHPIADLPRVKVPADIVKNQSLGVDVVSGRHAHFICHHQWRERCAQTSGTQSR